MSEAARRPLRSLLTPGDRPCPPHLCALRLRLADGAWTTLHVATYPATVVALGATRAINLDGGGSTSLVCGGALRNRPREGDGAPIRGGRPVTTALVFTGR